MLNDMKPLPKFDDLLLEQLLKGLPPIYDI